MGIEKLKKCLEYEYIKVNGKDIYIFNSHNMALTVWGTYSSVEGKMFNLVTFDSHADTRPPFTSEVVKQSDNYIITPDHPVIKKILKTKKVKKDNFNFEDVYNIASCYLDNDEHIQTAYYFDYIKSYTIICDLDSFEAKGYESDDRVTGYDAKYYTREQQYSIDYDSIEAPLILDFDLDYFITDDSINERLKNYIAPIIKKASVITIAREPEYFDKCKIQSNYSNTQALNNLLKMIEKVLTE